MKKTLLLLVLVSVLALGAFACDKNRAEGENAVTRFTLELVSVEDDDAALKEEDLDEGETEYYAVTGYSFSTDDAAILSRAADYPYYYTDEYDGERKDTNEYKAERERYESFKTLSVPSAVKLAGRESKLNLTYEQLLSQKDGLIDLSDGADKATEIKVRAISESAFLGHNEVETLIVPDACLYIGSGAFSGMSALKEVTLPFVGQKEGAVNGAKVFGYVFGTSEYSGGTSVTQSYNLSGTADYYIPSGLKTITVGGALPVYAFYNVSMAETINYSAPAEQNGQTTIPAYAFYGCSALKSIAIADNVTAIGAGAFGSCSSLDGIDFTKLTKLTHIYDSAFSGCSKLGFKDKALTLPSSLTFIGENAFANLTSVEKLTLNATAVSVRKNAFAGLTALESAEITNADFSVGAFSNWKQPWKEDVNAEAYSWLEVTLKSCKLGGEALTSDNKLMVFVGAFEEAADLQKQNIQVTLG